MIEPIPVNILALSPNVKKYVNECIDTGWISSEGPFVERFEKNLAAYVGRKHGVAVANGSAALDIAVKAIGIQPGDEVIMPTFTIISPALSVIRAGAVPVLVDSEADTWNMNVDEIESKITSKTKAILVVHIYGLPVDMDKVIAIAKKHSLKVIEDAAEMHGQTYKGKQCGSFGDISIFSFYPNKAITTGGGGMILCDDEELDKECRKLRNLAFEPTAPRFVHYDIGWNYRMTNVQAAIGVAQLEEIDVAIKAKRDTGAYYNQHLQFLTNHGYQLPLQSTNFADNIYWVYGLVAPTEGEKNKVVKVLTEMKIGTRPFFWCMHQQPVFKQMNLFKNDHYPKAERLATHGFYIPAGAGITEAQMEIVCKTIKEIYT